MVLKKEFLHHQYLLMSISASLQHAGLYRVGTSDSERIEFREYLGRKIKEIISDYRQPISEARHEQNIEVLARIITEKYGHLFTGGRYRIGLAQKALNLFLKYLWCDEEIPSPPHCPFDRMIIDKLPGNAHLNWTEMDDIDEYRKLVVAAKNVAQGVSLAEWELQGYQRALLESGTVKGNQ